jgi:hypothetical protein
LIGVGVVVAPDGSTTVSVMADGLTRSPDGPVTLVEMR